MATAVLLLAAGCGGGRGGLPSGAQEVGHTDLNPKPRDQLKDGGTLRLPMDNYPNNFNYNHVDGTNADILHITQATLPAPFGTGPDGGPVLNPDYLTSAQITATAPQQVVTYVINPKAVWSDGSPITWRDFASYWQSQNGHDPAFQTSGTVGYSDIGSVARGADDKQVTVTFNRPFAEWKNLFSPLYPQSATATPRAFNTAYRDGLPLTSGPFTLDSVDPVTKTITLKRDPRWWATPAKLDRIVFRQSEPQSRPDALANNELDWFDIGSDVDLLRRAQSSPGATVRDAPSQYATMITFNGSRGAILADPAVRKAVAQGIDRAAITQQLIGRVEPGAKPNGNHIYRQGDRAYRDNSGELPYDPTKAAQALEAAGWAGQGTGPRVKNGKQLALRLAYGIAPTNDDIGKALQNQLGKLGIAVLLQPLSDRELWPTINVGNFDLALFSWGTTSSPLSSSVDIYGSPLGDLVRQNYGRVSDPQIDKLFTAGIAELDDTKRADIGNQIDRLIWREAHSIVLFTRPGAVAVRSNLANFGAFGLADQDYINAGFEK